MALTRNEICTHLTNFIVPNLSATKMTEWGRWLLNQWAKK